MHLLVPLALGAAGRFSLARDREQALECARGLISGGFGVVAVRQEMLLL